MRADLMMVGRSLSELGRGLRWTDLRAFISVLGVESNFWKRTSPEGAAKAAKQKEVLSIHNQLLTMIHDAVWDVAYAQAGSEERRPRLLDEVLSAVVGVEKEEVASSEVDREAGAREVAEMFRRQRAEQ